MATRMLDYLILPNDLSRSYLEDTRRIKPFPLSSGGTQERLYTFSSIALQ
jgi:hypothetical protein